MSSAACTGDHTRDSVNIMGTNVQIDSDQALANLVTLAVATFAVVTVAGVAHGRCATAISAASGTSKQIKDEGGVLMAVTAASGTPAVWFTEAGLARLELERANAPGY